MDGSCWMGNERADLHEDRLTIALTNAAIMKTRGAPPMSRRIVALGLVLASFVGCNAESAPRITANPPRYSGAQWLGWSSLTRDVFVFAFIDGYKQGVSDACRAGDRLFDFKNGVVPDHSKDEIPSPSTLCRANSGQYSNCKIGAPEGRACGAYTEIITAFYTKYPEYRGIPFEYLMQYLTDKDQKNADELHAIAKSGAMRTS